MPDLQYDSRAPSVNDGRPAPPAETLLHAEDLIETWRNALAEAQAAVSEAIDATRAAWDLVDETRTALRSLGGEEESALDPAVDEIDCAEASLLEALIELGGFSVSTLKENVESGDEDENADSPVAD
jgi:hypothetical protein